MVKSLRIVIREEDRESSFLVREQITMCQVDWTQIKGIEGEILIAMNLQRE